MIKYIKILLVFLSVSLFLTACEKKKDEQVKKELIKSVYVTIPKVNKDNEKRVFNAIASSNNQIKLSFKVQGNLNYFKLRNGDEVKKGQLIAKLDSKPYSLKVSQVKYGLSEAKASLQNAKNIYERTKKLYVNQNASVSDIDKARANYNASKAKVNNVSKELEYANLQLSYTKLYAPLSGYISSKFVSQNENIAVGTPIVLISDKLVDEVSIHLPESYINKIKKGDSAKVTFTSIDKKIFDSKISEVSKFISENSKTYLVIVKLQESSQNIKSGMSADVSFNILNKSSKQIYKIPSNSVLNDNQGYFVYILKKEDKKYFIKRKNIDVGKLKDDGFEVLEGLEKNDLVLKAGMSEVFENMEVLIGNKKELGL
jgi:RND family efflux transporter MFP subunit